MLRPSPIFQPFGKEACPLDFGSVKVSFASLKPIKRVSVVEASAQALAELIRSGQWQDRIPGTRLLAQQLEVSQPTIQKALQLLAHQGVLTPAGERRAYEVASKTVRKRAQIGRERKTIVILTHQELHLLVDSAQKVIESLRKLLASKGWEVLFRQFDYLHAKAPHRSWERILGVGSEVPVIALYGRTCLAEWALALNLRIAFLGGVTDGLPVPKFSVSSSQMLADAYRLLIGLGHRRIVTPLCDRAASFSNSIKESARQEFELAGLPYSPTYTNPERDYLRPDVTVHLLENLFSQSPPTALVLLDWRELITSFCFLSKLGLKVPEDVSLVLLNEQSDTEWFTPSLARFRFQTNRIVRLLLQWAEGRNLPASKQIIQATWVPGDSIGPPP
jgi:DNA-binding LacI/PurR family transcriptional regulator